MIPVTELIRWLQTLPAESEVGIDEGGLTLLCTEDPAYYEIGGMRLPEEEEAHESH